MSANDPDTAAEAQAIGDAPVDKRAPSGLLANGTYAEEALSTSISTMDGNKTVTAEEDAREVTRPVACEAVQGDATADQAHVVENFTVAEDAPISKSSEAIDGKAAFLDAPSGGETQTGIKHDTSEDAPTVGHTTPNTDPTASFQQTDNESAYSPAKDNVDLTSRELGGRKSNPNDAEISPSEVQGSSEPINGSLTQQTALHPVEVPTETHTVAASTAKQTATDVPLPASDKPTVNGSLPERTGSEDITIITPVEPHLISSEDQSATPAATPFDPAIHDDNQVTEASVEVPTALQLEEATADAAKSSLTEEPRETTEAEQLNESTPIRTDSHETSNPETTSAETASEQVSNIPDQPKQSEPVDKLEAAVAPAALETELSQSTQSMEKPDLIINHIEGIDHLVGNVAETQEGNSNEQDILDTDIVTAGPSEEGVISSGSPLTLDTTADSQAVERPKSPYTPSYSVTTQGPGMTTSHVLEEEAAARGTAEELEESEAVPAGHFDVKSGSVDGPSPPINAEPTANEPPPPPYEEPISADEVAATNTNVQDAPEGHNAGESHLGDNAAQSLSVDVSAQHDAERPKSPWTPSYSVTNQGAVNLEKEKELDSLEQLPEPAPQQRLGVDDTLSNTMVLETHQTDVVLNQAVGMLSTNQEANVPEILDEQSIVISRNAPEFILKEDQSAMSPGMDQTEATTTAAEQDNWATLDAAPAEIERPKSPYSPSYSVTHQGRGVSTPAGEDIGADEQLGAPIEGLADDQKTLQCVGSEADQEVTAADSVSENGGRSDVPEAPLSPRSDLGILTPSFDTRSEVSAASREPAAPASPRIDPEASIVTEPDFTSSLPSLVIQDTPVGGGDGSLDGPDAATPLPTAPQLNAAHSSVLEASAESDAGIVEASSTVSEAVSGYTAGDEISSGGDAEDRESSAFDSFVEAAPASEQTPSEEAGTPILFNSDVSSSYRSPSRSEDASDNLAGEGADAASRGVPSDAQTNLVNLEAPMADLLLNQEVDKIERSEVPVKIKSPRDAQDVHAEMETSTQDTVDPVAEMPVGLQEIGERSSEAPVLQERDAVVSHFEPSIVPQEATTREVQVDILPSPSEAPAVENASETPSKTSFSQDGDAAVSHVERSTKLEEPASFVQEDPPQTDVALSGAEPTSGPTETPEHRSEALGPEEDSQQFAPVALTESKVETVGSSVVRNEAPPAYVSENETQSNVIGSSDPVVDVVQPSIPEGLVEDVREVEQDAPVRPASGDVLLSVPEKPVTVEAFGVMDTIKQGPTDKAEANEAEHTAERLSEAQEEAQNEASRTHEEASGAKDGVSDAQDEAGLGLLQNYEQPIDSSIPPITSKTDALSSTVESEPEPLSSNDFAESEAQDHSEAMSELSTIEDNSTEAGNQEEMPEIPTSVSTLTIPKIDGPSDAVSAQDTERKDAELPTRHPSERPVDDAAPPQELLVKPEGPVLQAIIASTEESAKDASSVVIGDSRRQPFPSSDTESDAEVSADPKPVISPLATVQEDVDENRPEGPSSGYLDVASPTTTRKRLESTSSSRYFPGGWFSSSPKLPERTSLDNAEGVFVLNSPQDENTAPILNAAAEEPSLTAPQVQDEEKKGWSCIVM